MPDFTRSPRYQRAMQRLRRMSPEQQAVFSSLSLDKAFASQEMGKKVRSIQMGAERESRQASLELGERRLGLGKRRHEFAKSQILPATIAGLGEVALGVYGGLERRKTSQEIARLSLALRRQYGTPTTAPRRPYWGQ